MTNRLSRRDQPFGRTVYSDTLLLHGTHHPSTIMSSPREVSLLKYGHEYINNNNDLKPAKNGVMQTIAGVMGNVLEWYDFALFGFFSDIIAQVFFPPSTNIVYDDDAVDFGGEIDTSNLINSFAVYGGGKSYIIIVL